MWLSVTSYNDFVIFLVSDNKSHTQSKHGNIKMNLEDQIHENALLKKKIAKLEEKLILAGVKEKEQSDQIWVSTRIHRFMSDPAYTKISNLIS